VLVAVGTPVRQDGSFDDRQLVAVGSALSAHLRPGQLVVLKSTVPPGSTRGLLRPLLERSGLVAGVDFGLAFCPERLAEGTAMAELRTLPIVVGGLDAETAAVAAAFWSRGLGVETVPMDTLEAAEITKLADNWWIDLNIALGNELAKFCDLFGVDVLDVIGAANAIPKGASTVNILRPSVGVGGSCLTKDPWMVWRAARERGLDIRTAPTAREVNAGMPAWTARIVREELAAAGKDVAGATVAVLGLAFKNDTGDLRETPTVGVVEELVADGADVRLHDPLADKLAVKELFGIKPLPSIEEAVRDADVVAVLALHREFGDVDLAALPVARGCRLVDGRAYFDRERIATLRAQGFGYRGIGR